MFSKFQRSPSRLEISQRQNSLGSKSWPYLLAAKLPLKMENEWHQWPLRIWILKVYY